jgi:NADPH:quinone reductase-like Zn-dependent oxidoreductase
MVGAFEFGQGVWRKIAPIPMKKIIQSTFGGPDVFELIEAERPQPLPTEILVRVHATSVNPVEAFIRAGHFPLIGQPPFTLGWDVSGVVEEVVPGTSRFKVGDAVYGMPFFPRAANAYAEYVAAPSRQLALKPRNLTHAQAAAVPLAGLSAWQALVDWGELKSGQRVLIHGAAGGVGHLAVQLAKYLGAEVIATASQSKHAYLASLGVDQLIDYQKCDFAAAVRDVDLVLDVIGRGYAQRSLQVLKPGGLLVTAVERTSTELPRLAASLGRRFAGLGVEPDYVALERLTGLIEKGAIVPHVAHEFPLAEIGRAHAAIETGSTMGKIAVIVRPDSV